MELFPDVINSSINNFTIIFIENNMYDFQTTFKQDAGWFLTFNISTKLLVSHMVSPFRNVAASNWSLQNAHINQNFNYKINLQILYGEKCFSTCELTETNTEQDEGLFFLIPFLTYGQRNIFLLCQRN